MAVPPDDPREREQAESLARVEGGDIPLGAERRLAELRETAGAYTSDLSTADFALCRQLGLRPVAQVMGSSIYQVGYQASRYGMGRGLWQYGSGMITELETLTEAWNEARGRALYRLSREAQEVGADAVVGVSVRSEAKNFGDASMSSGAIEYSVVGTAVRRERPGTNGAPARGRRLVLTELSVADYVKLVHAGMEPAGIAAWSSVFFATYGYATAMRAQSGFFGQGLESFELREFTEAIYAAREQVMERLGGQARALEASGIVGVRIGHQMRRQSIGAASQEGLLVTFHAIGTAINETAGARVEAPKPILDLTA